MKLLCNCASNFKTSFCTICCCLVFFNFMFGCRAVAESSGKPCKTLLPMKKYMKSVIVNMKGLIKVAIFSLLFACIFV